MELNDADIARIRETAYFKWLNAGAPNCDGVDYWLDAEFEYVHDIDRDVASPSADSQIVRRGRSRPLQTTGRPDPALPNKEEVIGSRG